MSVDKKWIKFLQSFKVKAKFQLLVKKALHIQLTPVEECFNWDVGLEVPGWWMADWDDEAELRNSLVSNELYS